MASFSCNRATVVSPGPFDYACSKLKDGFQGWTGSAPDNLAGKGWRWHLLQKLWPHWAGRLTPRDLGAVTPLIWEHVINPFGRFGLDLGGPGSISVQMASGDTTVGRSPCSRDQEKPGGYANMPTFHTGDLTRALR
jgi:hypothetical protein